MSEQRSLEEMNKDIELDGYKVEELLDLFKHFQMGRKEHERVWRLLDAYDRGMFWDTLKKKLAPHQLLPDTNYVNYIKTNITNGVYASAYRADVFPRSFQHTEAARKINAFLEYVWDKLDISDMQLRAGDRAALLNLGAVQIGWDADVIDGTQEGKRYSGDVDIKFIDTMALYLDPAVRDPYKGRAMVIADEVTITELEAEPRFRARAKQYKKWKSENGNFESTPMSNEDYGKGYYGQRRTQSKDMTVRLLTFFYKVSTETGYRIDQIELIDDGYILGVKKDMKPKRFPIVLLYATPPVVDSYGVPVPKLVLSNIMTINMIDSIEATHAYASQRRTRLISLNSNLDIKTFAKYGNDPDKVFAVAGQPDQVVKYVDLPQLYSGMSQLRQRLEDSIFLITGVDMRYTGRDTGSVQTTGGMDMMQAKISMSDNVRIIMLEKFAKDITHMVLDMYLQWGDKREFPVKDNGHVVDAMEIDFDEIKKSGVRFDYTVHAGPHLPKNRMRIAEAANIMMEKQMQYQFNPQLITAEEWLATQDFPQKNHMLDRIEWERQQEELQNITSTLGNFAGLVGQNVRPEEAVKMMADEQAFQRKNPGLGNVGNANSFQAKQMG